MRLLVTGGSGFIGTNLINFYESKYEIINIDIIEPKISSHFKYWKKCDICDLEKMRSIVTDFNPDFIIHLAARTDLNGLSLNEYEANITGVNNVISVAQGLQNLRKIIVTSSMLVCQTGYIPKNEKDYYPSTMYGKSKVETENIVWGSDLKCDWCIIRPTSIWGEFFGVPYRNFFDLVLSKKYFHIGKKSCTKTYGYVGNAVCQIDNLLRTDTISKNNKVFYIGDYIPTNIEDWANEISLVAFGHNCIRFPYWIIKIAALFGDLLKKLNINFPMSSFRLKNMTTNNIVPLENTKEVAPLLPFDRITAIRRTLDWMKDNK